MSNPPKFPLQRAAKISKRKHHLEIDAAVRRLGVEWPAGKADRLSKQRRAQVSYRCCRIDNVEQVSRTHAEGHAVALAGLLPDHERAATASGTTASPGASPSATFHMRSSTLALLPRVRAFHFRADANRLCQAHVKSKLSLPSAEVDGDYRLSRTRCCIKSSQRSLHNRGSSPCRERRPIIENRVAVQICSGGDVIRFAGRKHHEWTHPETVWQSNAPAKEQAAANSK